MQNECARSRDRFRFIYDRHKIFTLLSHSLNIRLILSPLNSDMPFHRFQIIRGTYIHMYFTVCNNFISNNCSCNCEYNIRYFSMPLITKQHIYKTYFEVLVVDAEQAHRVENIPHNTLVLRTRCIWALQRNEYENRTLFYFVSFQAISPTWNIWLKLLLFLFLDKHQIFSFPFHLLAAILEEENYMANAC